MVTKDARMQQHSVKNGFPRIECVTMWGLDVMTALRVEVIKVWTLTLSGCHSSSGSSSSRISGTAVLCFDRAFSRLWEGTCICQMRAVTVVFFIYQSTQNNYSCLGTVYRLKARRPKNKRELKATQATVSMTYNEQMLDLHWNMSLTTRRTNSQRQHSRNSRGDCGTDNINEAACLKCQMW